jgi:hypothetical protein
VVDAARHKIIACTFRCTLHENRRFDLNEPELIEVFPSNLIHPVPRNEVLLHRRSPKIEVTILQAKFLGRFHLIFNFERRCYSRIEDCQIGGNDVNLAGRNALVLLPRGASHDVSGNRNDVLASQLRCILVKLLIDFRIEDNLRLAVSIAKVDENQATQVAA